MRFDSVIYLVSYTTGKNAMKDVTRTPVKRQTFAKKKSVRQSEKYQAAAAGLQPELMFVVWKREYEGEPDLEYDGKIYTIIRTFEKDEEKMELICSISVNKAVT